jgi:neurotransmitter:Na+ symporter, NSS family
VVELVEERTPLNRAGATALAGLATWALGIAALLSFNQWGDVTFFGLNTFDLLDQLTSKLLLPLTGLGAIVFAAWCLDQESVRRELKLSDGGYALWRIVTRFVAPIGVLAVFFGNL